MAAGAAADQVIDAARRRTVSRRELEHAEGFEQISPEVGELDEDAFAEALESDADEAMSLLADLTRATDVRLRAAARQLAATLFLDLAQRERPVVGGIGRIVRTPLRVASGDLDVDASLDVIVSARASRSAVQADDLVVGAWARPTTAWCLLVDRSGSMHGRPIATAAIAAAAVALRAEHDYAVLTFAGDHVAAKAMWEQRTREDVVDRTLALTGHGTTDVAGALRAGREQLGWSGASRRVAVLMSDCRPTLPGDVVAAAAALDELVILAPEGDSAEAEALGDAVGARVATVSGPSQVAAALADLLAR